MTKPDENLQLSDLAAKTFACTCGIDHTIAVQEMLLQQDALPQIADVVRRHLPGKNGLLIADAVTYPLAGNRTLEYLADADYNLGVLLLPARPDGHVVADDQTVDYVYRHISPSIDFLLAVGSGTVNDVAKLASFKAERPYLVCPTAPSMNGFTSAVAAILSGGVKRTMAAHLPVAVVADVGVLSTAPTVMMRAGLGDLISKPVSNADWRLAHMIKGEYYCDLPLRLVEQAERACRQHAVAIGQGTIMGAQTLTEALLRSGCSMAIAGSSSPASGGEHLLSHYWDMTAHWHGRQENFHGAQVGVATLVTATLYEKLRQVDPGQIDVIDLSRQYPTWAQYESAMQHIHGPLAAAVIPEAQKKYMALEQKEAEWHFIVENWSAIWQQLDAILSPAADIREILSQAGAPTTISELGVGEEELRTAFLHARDMRGRYTVLDFAHDLGLLSTLCDEVLQSSGVLD